MNQIDPKAGLLHLRSALAHRRSEDGTDEDAKPNGAKAPDEMVAPISRPDAAPEREVAEDPKPTITSPNRGTPQPESTLKPADVEVIVRALAAHPSKIARQVDLIKMHKSLVESMQRLGAGIGDQAARSAASDREALGARIDQMEEAINGMEAVLRIQLAPEIKSVIDDALAAQSTTPRARRAFSGFAVLGLALAFTAAGAVFSEELKVLASDGLKLVRGLLAN